ncbi:unnamed protein product [Ambrosiozyma monospora]|uniref:Unnamed protein product n=1 Tax=Ambrosiozyma monospora TaxID=43982 RepID=A0ACB5SR05_AMBMO|nr:unnamed protein product [Ambrosiozyma monospora]
MSKRSIDQLLSSSQSSYTDTENNPIITLDDEDDDEQSHGLHIPSIFNSRPTTATTTTIAIAIPTATTSSTTQKKAGRKPDKSTKEFQLVYFNPVTNDYYPYTKTGVRQAGFKKQAKCTHCGTMVIPRPKPYYLLHLFSCPSFDTNPSPLAKLLSDIFHWEKNTNKDLVLFYKDSKDGDDEVITSQQLPTKKKIKKN